MFFVNAKLLYLKKTRNNLFVFFLKKWDALYVY